MATIKSDNAIGINPSPTPVASEVISNRQKVPLSVAQLVTGNIVQMCFLPAYCLPVGYTLRATDMDSATAAVLDLGILTANGTALSTAAADGGAKWVAGSTLAQAGGILLDTASAAAWDILGAVQPVSFDRIVAVVIATQPGTPVAGSVEIDFKYKAV